MCLNIYRPKYLFHEMIKLFLDMFRTKHGHMEKFPDDVIRAETAVGGDLDILTREEFREAKKESYAGLFGNPKKTPVSVKKGIILFFFYLSIPVSLFCTTKILIVLFVAAEPISTNFCKLGNH